MHCVCTRYPVGAGPCACPKSRKGQSVHFICYLLFAICYLRKKAALHEADEAFPFDFKKTDSLIQPEGRIADVYAQGNGAVSVCGREAEQPEQQLASQSPVAEIRKEGNRNFRRMGIDEAVARIIPAEKVLQATPTSFFPDTATRAVSPGWPQPLKYLLMAG